MGICENKDVNGSGECYKYGLTCYQAQLLGMCKGA